MARGFNLVAAPGHRLGSDGAGRALAAARAMGADTIALVLFLWQPAPDSAAIVRGADMDDAELAAGIAQARSLGLRVMVKPHVWVPQSWAGAVRMRDAAGWAAWFDGYATALAGVGQVARAGGAEWLSVGTELAGTSHRPEWGVVIARARAAFAGRLLYIAHNAEEAIRVPFWPMLDAVGASLWPALGEDPAGWRGVMAGQAGMLDRLSAAHRRPVWIGEIGLRSAVGAAARPWESAEERAAQPDEEVQAAVISAWLDVLDRPSVGGVLVWRILSDPAAGGPRDTDFTIQGKAAERMLRRRW